MDAGELVSTFVERLLLQQIELVDESVGRVVRGILRFGHSTEASESKASHASLSTKPSPTDSAEVLNPTNRIAGEPVSYAVK